MKNLLYNTFNPENSNICANNNIVHQNQKEIKENDNQESFKKDLIMVFIYLYYYEKICSEKNSNIFRKKDRYYIINPDWIEKYKKYYNYEQLENVLKKENKHINYFNLIKFYDDISNNCLKNKNILNFEKKELSQELKKNISYIIKKNYNIFHLLKGLIIPSKIMNIIKNIHNISIKPNLIIFNDNNIFFIKKNNIIVGNDSDIPKILSKYVFNYKDNALNSEKNKILLHNISEYIQLRKCNENNKDLQTLKNEKNEELGKFFIINYENEKPNEGNIKEFCYKSLPKKENNLKSLNPPYLTNRNLNNNNYTLTNFDNKQNQIERYLSHEIIQLNNQQTNSKILKDLENKDIEIKQLKEELVKLKMIINNYHKKEGHEDMIKGNLDNINEKNELENRIKETEKHIINLNSKILSNQNEEKQNNQDLNSDNNTQNDMTIFKSIGPNTLIKKIESNRNNYNSMNNNIGMKNNNFTKNNYNFGINSNNSDVNNKNELNPKREIKKNTRKKMNL